MTRDNKPPKRRAKPSGWDPVAGWYDGWMGKGGSEHHRKSAVPALLDLLDLREGEQVLDMGCGQGVLAPFVAQAKAHYTGVDVSQKLLALARQHHGAAGRFLEEDAGRLTRSSQLKAGTFDAVVFLLSIQDMDPLAAVLRSTSWALKSGGRVAILMTHPCFRIPRQSGWGTDERRKLQYRRIDRYLTPLPIPMKTYPGQESGVTISFHRPLHEYVNGLAACGLLVDRLEEIASNVTLKTNPADSEIPLFMGLRARKVS